MTIFKLSDDSVAVSHPLQCSCFFLPHSDPVHATILQNKQSAVIIFLMVHYESNQAR